MSTNKHAIIRYHALDKCFTNRGRRFCVNDLIEYCNRELYEHTGELHNVKKRQIYYDIAFMESEQGWAIPLERKKIDKKVYFRYSDHNFTIKNRGLNESEFNLLTDTLFFLKRFGGLPNFEWIDEIVIRLESEFKIKNKENFIVSFEQNPYLKGIEFFTTLFNAISYKRVLDIKYKGFKQENPNIFRIHPYHLKQFNSRWFLFGLNSEFNDITVLALDRILDIAETNIDYIDNDIIDFNEYFEDVIGVTVDKHGKCEKILIEIDRDRWPYVESKPIHGSQKVKEKNENHVVIQLSLQINNELIALLLSFGKSIKIVHPQSLRDIIVDIANNIIKKHL